MPTTRFDQAREYVADARNQLGILHSALRDGQNAGMLTPRLSIAVTTLLDRLREALDRCAAELHARVVAPKHPSANPPKTYFPIAPKGQKAPKQFPDFATWVNKKQIPKLNDERPDLVQLLESFQEFSSQSQNWWLPEFATLSNKNKHDEDDPSAATSVPAISFGGVEVVGKPALVVVSDLRTKDGPVNVFQEGSNPPQVQGTPGVPVVQSIQTVARFDAVNREVWPFMLQAVGGVGRMVEEIIKKV